MLAQGILLRSAAVARQTLPRICLLSRHLSSNTTAPPPDVDTSKSPSVSMKELTKFAQISNTWWDPSGPFKYLHTMNRPRMQFLRETLADLYHRQSRSDSVEWMQGMSAVDVGCGGGLASEAMARMGLHVLGIDAAAENVEIARLHQQKDHALTQGSLLRYAQTTAEQLVLTDRKFDVVVSLEVIEHVTDPVAFCKSLVDLAKPGALIVLSTMNRTPVSFIVDVLVPEYLMGWVPRGTHDHSKFVAPEELARIFQSLGAQALDTRGLIMDPLSNQCHLVPNDLGLLRNAGVQANYITAFRKTINLF